MYIFQLTAFNLGKPNWKPININMSQTWAPISRRNHWVWGTSDHVDRSHIWRSGNAHMVLGNMLHRAPWHVDMIYPSSSSSSSSSSCCKGSSMWIPQGTSMPVMGSIATECSTNSFPGDQQKYRDDPATLCLSVYRWPQEAKSIKAVRFKDICLCIEVAGIQLDVHSPTKVNYICMFIVILCPVCCLISSVFVG